MFRKIDKKYWNLFWTICACIGFYFLLTNVSQVWSAIQWFFNLISPIFYGFAITYVLTPLYNLLLRLFKKAAPKWKEKVRRVLCVTLTYIVLFIVLAAILLVIVPQTVESITTLIANFSEYSRSFAAFVQKITASIDAVAPGAFSRGNPLEMLQDVFSRYGPEVLSSFPEALSRITAVTGNIVIGLLLSVYMLYDKEMLCARVKKMMTALFGEEKAHRSVFLVREINETVGSFINEKLVASLILGLVCYVLFLIFGIEFPGLLAAICGITNIIPVLGPIIGAVICALLLLFVAPRHVIGFLIIILILQQIEGNVISPRILGHMTGVSGFWVMICLTIGGGLFGIVGMVLSVPIFAVAYRLLTEAVDAALEKRALTIDTTYYRDHPPHDPPASSQRPAPKPFRIKWPLFGKNKKKEAANKASTQEEPEVSSQPTEEGKAEEKHEDL